jgi:hypothetical protein
VQHHVLTAGLAFPRKVSESRIDLFLQEAFPKDPEDSLTVATFARDLGFDPRRSNQLFRKNSICCPLMHLQLLSMSFPQEILQKPSAAAKFNFLRKP